ncbi:hypothetical protein P7K49_036513 [Saguinus oedipus]|uniref:Uncharacterized protein n=1 Tax=Saguinus oedipus TaxID=9490 RepID=A0ABQ9TKF6_SAGOE|nr:hypothetical protein P7K49_036513 [Saguinus oedipus]
MGPHSGRNSPLPHAGTRVRGGSADGSSQKPEFGPECSEQPPPQRAVGLGAEPHGLRARCGLTPGYWPKAAAAAAPASASAETEISRLGGGVSGSGGRGALRGSWEAEPRSALPGGQAPRCTLCGLGPEAGLLWLPCPKQRSAPATQPRSPSFLPARSSPGAPPGSRRQALKETGSLFSFARGEILSKGEPSLGWDAGRTHT